MLLNLLGTPSDATDINFCGAFITGGIFRSALDLDYNGQKFNRRIGDIEDLAQICLNEQFWKWANGPNTY